MRGAGARRLVEQRKLATIMSVDVAGYSRAAEFDDGAAAEAVGVLRRAIEDVIVPFGGRIFNSAGDGFMIEFPAASSGAQAALKLLTESDARPLPKIRIGLHLGEVIAVCADDHIKKNSLLNIPKFNVLSMIFQYGGASSL